MMLLGRCTASPITRSVSGWTLGLVTTLIAVLLIAAPATAEPPDDVRKAAKEFNFETDEIEVDILKPDAEMFEVLKAKARKSLIRIRMDFIKEIVRSAEDI